MCKCIPAAEMCFAGQIDVVSGVLLDLRNPGVNGRVRLARSGVWMSFGWVPECNAFDGKLTVDQRTCRDSAPRFARHDEP